jgi:hypothetical protein
LHLDRAEGLHAPLYIHTHHYHWSFERAFTTSGDMASVPREIFDLIFLAFAEYECSVTERLPTLTAASKQAILNARLAWPAFCHEYPLRELFLNIIAEVPFPIPTRFTHQLPLPTLQNLSSSPYAKHITILSFHAPWHYHHTSQQNTATIFLPFPKLKHIIYHTLPPHQRNATLHEPLRNTRTQQHQQNEYTGCYNVLFENLPPSIETLAMPLHGIASYLTACHFELGLHTASFYRNLRHISINLAIQDYPHPHAPLFGPWLGLCEQLEYLDVAVTRGWTSEHRLAPQRLLETDVVLRKLREIRIMAEPNILFSETGLLAFASTFRYSLKKLGLAHIRLGEGMGSWSGVLDGLTEMELERVWLLNPLGEERRSRSGTWLPCLCDGKIEVSVAEKVKVKHINSPWEEGETSLKSVYKYPGFGVFE